MPPIGHFLAPELNVLQPIQNLAYSFLKRIRFKLYAFCNISSTEVVVFTLRDVPFALATVLRHATDLIVHAIQQPQSPSWRSVTLSRVESSVLAENSLTFSRPGPRFDVRPELG